MLNPYLTSPVNLKIRSEERRNGLDESVSSDFSNWIHSRFAFKIRTSQGILLRLSSVLAFDCAPKRFSIDSNMSFGGATATECFACKRVTIHSSMNHLGAGPQNHTRQQYSKNSPLILPQ